MRRPLQQQAILILGALLLATTPTITHAFVLPTPSSRHHHHHRSIPSSSPRSTTLPTTSRKSPLSPRIETTRLSVAPIDPEAISTAVTVAAGAAAAKSGIFSSIGNNAASLLVLCFIVSIHELGHFLGARLQGIKVKNYSIGFGPKLLSFKEGPEEDDIEYTIRGIPAGGFVSFPPHYEVDDDGEIIRYEDQDLLQNRPPLQQAIVISAGVIANVFLSFSLLLGSVATTGLPRPQFSEGPYVMRLVEKDCPAAKAGIQPEDLILAVNGQKVSGDEAGLGNAVSLISQSGGQPVELKLRRSGAEITKSVTPAFNADTGRRSIGVQMAAHIEKINVIKAKDFGEAVKFSSEELTGMLREATSSLKRFSSAGMEGLTGPLGKEHRQHTHR